MKFEINAELSQLFEKSGISPDKEEDTKYINNLLNAGISFYKFIQDYKKDKQKAIKILDENIKIGSL